MAKHFVKLGEGHYAWLTDSEYKKHKRGGCLTMIIVILILAVFKNKDGKTKDNDRSDFKTEQVSKKKQSQLKKEKIQSSKKDKKSTENSTRQDVSEEIDAVMVETPSALELQIDPIGVEAEDPEEINPIVEPENDAVDEFIEEFH